MQSFLRQNAWIILILLIASALRFFNLGEMSLFNDELSALSRIQYDNVKDLVEHGVKLNDTHPAAVQLFIYYWTRIFGISEFAVRFPFAAAGIFSVLMIYVMGKNWFGKTCGLLAAAAMAALQFPVYYSQLARPYSIGLFFSLLLVLSWTKVLFPDQNQKSNPIAIGSNLLLKYILFASAFTACLYVHYFSGMFAGIVAATGIFFTRKESRIPYLLSSIIPVLLFLPHISITLHQFSQKGLAWLPPPDSNWLFGHLWFIFNRSLPVLILFCGAAIICFLFFLSDSNFSRFHFFSLLFFLLPFVIGFSYSVWRSPVLQHSTLIFSYPFFFLFLFSFSEAIKNRIFSNALILLGLIIGLYSTVIEKKYYTTEHHGDFKKITQKTLHILDKYGEENVAVTFHVIHPYYINYYFSKYGNQPEILQYQCLSDSATTDLVKIVSNSKKDYFIRAWSNIYDLPEAELLIKTKFPFVVDRDLHFNSGLILFSKKNDGSIAEPAPLFSMLHDFEITKWNNDNVYLTNEDPFSGTQSAKLNDFEYGPTWKSFVKEIPYEAGRRMNISVKVFAKEIPVDAVLVFTISKNDTTLFWRGKEMNAFITKQNDWQDAFLSLELPPAADDFQLAVYAWNKNRKKLMIDDLKIEITE